MIAIDTSLNLSTTADGGVPQNVGVYYLPTDSDGLSRSGARLVGKLTDAARLVFAGFVVVDCGGENGGCLDNFAAAWVRA